MVGSDAAQQLYRKVGQDVGRPGDVVAGVAQDQDVRVTGLVLAAVDQALYRVA